MMRSSGHSPGSRCGTIRLTALQAFLGHYNMPFDAVEDVVLHLDGPDRRVEVPVAIVADRDADGTCTARRSCSAIRASPVRGRGCARALTGRSPG